MDLGPYALVGQPPHHGRPVDAGAFEVDQHLVQVGRDPLSRSAGTHRLDDSAERFERQIVEQHQLAPPARETLQLAQLAQSQRGLQLVHAIVEAELGLLVGPGVQLAIRTQRKLGVDDQIEVLGHAVIRQPAHPRGAVGIGGGDHAALAGRQGLDRMEGEGRRLRMGAGAHSLARGVVAAQRMAGVLDDGEPGGPGCVRNLVHGADAAAEVDRDDAPGFAGRLDQRGLQRLGGHQP